MNVIHPKKEYVLKNGEVVTFYDSMDGIKVRSSTNPNSIAFDTTYNIFGNPLWRMQQHADQLDVDWSQDPSNEVTVLRTNLIQIIHLGLQGINPKSAFAVGMQTILKALEDGKRINIKD